MKTLITLVLITATTAFGQTFRNLNFEEATVVPTNTASLVPASAAFPYWTVYRDGVAQMQVVYNGATNPKSGISLWASNTAAGASRPSFFNQFSAVVTPDARDTATIGLGQVGMVPVTASLLTFQTWGTREATEMQLSFAGILLPIQFLGSTNSVDVWSSDVAAFAGQSGELLFSTPSLPQHPEFFLDNFQFVSIPEPSTWALLGAGAVMFAWLRLRKRRF